MPESPLTVYTYAKCSTCREAVKWLRAHRIDFVEKPIRETPPTLAELRRMLALQDGSLRRLFNTSGQDYRAMGLGEKLPALTPDEALTLLTQNGNLVKRPFALGAKTGAVGFDAETWAAAFGG